MDPQYITPFIKSTKNVFSTMLNMPVTIDEPSIKAGSPATYDVSGIIGMSGDVVGSVVLSFPKETAEKLVTAFCGPSRRLCFAPATSLTAIAASRSVSSVVCGSSA